MLNINLGCGSVFVDSSDWLNLDFAPASPTVRKANLLRRLPVANESAWVVYSSHFLEHVPRAMVSGVLLECLRVLQPGGVLRLVVPDLENSAREYLTMREAGAHDKADFVVLELIDQCVRRESGGELGRFYRQLRAHPNASTLPMIDYIRARTGENLLPPGDPVIVEEEGGRLRTLRRIPGALRSRIERYWIRLCLLALPAAFCAQNVSLAAVGERHHWLWDFHQIKMALEAAGFVDVQRCSADYSAINDFPFHLLDLDADGRPRKAAVSLYVEARKADSSESTSSKREKL